MCRPRAVCSPGKIITRRERGAGHPARAYSHSARASPRGVRSTGADCPRPPAGPTGLQQAVGHWNGRSAGTSRGTRREPSGDRVQTGVQGTGDEDSCPNGSPGHSYMRRRTYQSAYQKGFQLNHHAKLSQYNTTATLNEKKNEMKVKHSLHIPANLQITWNPHDGGGKNRANCALTMSGH